jgi:hypothetical protein
MSRLLISYWNKELIEDGLHICYDIYRTNNDPNLDDEFFKQLDSALLIQLHTVLYSEVIDESTAEEYLNQSIFHNGYGLILAFKNLKKYGSGDDLKSVQSIKVTPSQINPDESSRVENWNTLETIAAGVAFTENFNRVVENLNNELRELVEVYYSCEK